MVVRFYCAVVNGQKGCCPNSENCTSGGNLSGLSGTSSLSGSVMGSKDPGSIFCLVPLLIIIGTWARLITPLATLPHGSSSLRSLKALYYI